MREHLRIDTIKVFDEEAKILERIMKKYGCTKSDAYRKALEIWDATFALHEENQELKNDLQEMKDTQAEMNHKLNLLLSK